VCNFDVDADNYWVVNPNEDTSCSSGLINLLQDVLANENLCLQIVKSGGIIDADKAIPGAQATINGQAQDFLIRAHNIEASGDVGQNKELSLKDAYLEIRYGKGQDRAATPFSNLGTTWGDPINNDTVVRSAGITNPFNCQGNRELGNPSCNIDSNRKTINNESYNNIHG
jgi:hypothetical protein